MEWFFYLLMGYIIWSLAVLVDRFALSGKVKNTTFYTLIQGLTKIIPLLPLFFFVDLNVGSKFFIIAFLTGVTEFVMLYFFYAGIGLEEVSRVVPLNTLFSSTFAWLLSWSILKDNLAGSEGLVFLIFLFGGFFLGFKHENKKLKLTKAALPVLFCGFLAGLEVVLMKYLFTHIDFWSAFLLMKVGSFCTGLLFLGLAWKEVKAQYLKLGFSMKALLVGNQWFAQVGDILYYTVLMSLNAALLKSSQGIMHAMVFIMATLITFWKPTWLKEDLRKNELLRKGIGVALIVLAVYLL